MQSNTDTVYDDALLVHVSAEIPACSSLGEAHIIAKSLGLTTYITLTGHGLAPFKKITDSATRDP